MTRRPQIAVVAMADAPPRIALTRAEAAQSIGVSVDFFEEHIQSELKLIRKGRRVLVPTNELQRWAERSAEPTLLPEAKR